MDASSASPRPLVGSLTTSRRAALVTVPLLVGACSGLYVSPLAPPPYHAEINARYDATWAALVRALAKENVPLRAIARDAGGLASDDFVAPTGAYAQRRAGGGEPR